MEATSLVGAYPDADLLAGMNISPPANQFTQIHDFRIYPTLRTGYEVTSVWALTDE